MVEIARITFDKFRGDKSRLLVEVYEHAGWFLSFAFIDGNVRCVSSANDAARFGEEVKEFWRRYNTEKNKKFVNIRRGEDT